MAVEPPTAPFQPLAFAAYPPDNILAFIEARVWHHQAVHLELSAER